LIVAVAAAVLVVAGVLVGVVLTSARHRSAPAKPQGKAQGVAGVAALLDRSTRARASVTQAIMGVENCHVDARRGLTQLGQAVQVRQQVLADLPAANAPTQLASALNDALRLSLDADRHFQSWMSFVALNGCPGRAPHNSDYSGATAMSSQASVAKQRFVDLWNLVAASNGLRQYHAGDF
jgi:hypothetical protein